MSCRPAAVAVLLAAMLIAGCGSSSGHPTASVPSASTSSAGVGAAPGGPSNTSGGLSTAPVSTARPGAIPPLSAGPTGPAHAAPRPASASSPPVRVRIPSIGVDSSLQKLGLLPDGALVPPSYWQVAGWYAGGVRPGDIGPAVIAGHVDSVSGPAVFYELVKLKPGNVVFVTRANGSTLRFTVARRDEYPKNKFPTEAVYGPTPVPTLRLVTCTGDFNYQARSYVDNLVVTAYLSR